MGRAGMGKLWTLDSQNHRGPRGNMCVIESRSVNVIFRSFLDTTQGGVVHPGTGEDLTIEDAVMQGVLDIPHASYVQQGEETSSVPNGHVSTDLMVR